jgi:hypothetical protein
MDTDGRGAGCDLGTAEVRKDSYGIIVLLPHRHHIHTLSHSDWVPDRDIVRMPSL